VSETTNTGAEASTQNASSDAASLKLNGLFAFKEGMATIYNEQGEAVPVTVLRYEPWFVSQIKTNENDGYEAIQVACEPKKAKNSNKAEKGHLSKAGFENGAKFVKELRQAAPEGLALGAQVSIESLVKGDIVKITSKSKGKGFAGSVKRWNFAGGPAAHGSKFHRRPGSSGNRTWPGRVMPGKKFPGHLGNETVTVKNVQIVEVIPSENVLMVRGPVPGARNTLVKLVKE
jgi:large subunit ribosomal protein L3